MKNDKCPELTVDGKRWWDPIRWLLDRFRPDRSDLSHGQIGGHREADEVKDRIWRAVRARLKDHVRFRRSAKGTAPRVGMQRWSGETERSHP